MKPFISAVRHASRSVSTLVFLSRARLPGLLAALALPLGAWGEVIDFEEFQPGDIVDEIVLDGVLNGTDGRVFVEGRPLQDGNAAMIFDAECDGHPSNCSGGDPDLFAPGQGNVLIVSENGNAANPDDQSGNGVLEFDFSDLGAITLYSFITIDVESAQAKVTVTTSDGSEHVVPITPTADGGVGGVSFGTGGMGIENVVGMLVELRGSGAIDDIVFEPQTIVLASECLMPDTEDGFCEIVTKLNLPDNLVLPPGATITQQTPDFFIDPRVNPLTGRCDGGGALPRGPLVLYSDTDNPLIIPEWLCGSPNLAVVITDKLFSIPAGVVEHEVSEEEVEGNELTCVSMWPRAPTPLYPDTFDPQMLSEFVWRSDDVNDTAEGRAVVRTTECINPSRGKTVDLSYIAIGLHRDCGVSFADAPGAVRQCFRNFVLTDFAFLRQAVRDARGVLSRRQHGVLAIVEAAAELAFAFGFYELAAHKLEYFLQLAEQASFSTNGFNHEGNLISRADSIRFAIETQVIPFR